MKIITVGNGFIANHLPYEIAKTKGEFGSTIAVRLTTNEEFIESFFDEHNPEVVVNCIGFCGSPNVDQCEIERSKTYMSNVVLPLMLAEACQKRDIQLIHIGSGCIFFGESPNIFWTDPRAGATAAKSFNYEATILPSSQRIDLGWMENDFANPKSYYSKCKYACDLALGQMDNVTTLRIRMPVSTQNTPRNFINKVKNYRQVIDVPNSMTFIEDLVGVVDWVIDNHKTGIYHVVNPGELSAADVMREYQKYVPSHKFEVITEMELDTMTLAKRSNCIINGNKLKSEGYIMTPSDIALKNCMAEYIKSI